MEKINSEWVCCPVCGNKTRDKIRKDTVLVIILFIARNANEKL